MTRAPRRQELYVKRRMSMANQFDVATALGISQSLYSNIENGYAHPSESVAKALIEMFNLPSDYFVNGGDQRGQEPHTPIPPLQ